MMQLCDALEIPRGVTSVVGGGGKTSLIDLLCAQLSQRGTVLRLTTARIYPPDCLCLSDPTLNDVKTTLSKEHLAAVGRPAEQGKWGPPDLPFEELFALADYVLIEADGSKGLPLKAPAGWEPALTGLETLVLGVAGMTGLEKPILEAAHRPERYASLIGKTLGENATPIDAATVLESSQGQKKQVECAYRAILNQCDTPERVRLGRQCAQALHVPCVLTALRQDPAWLEAYAGQ